MVANFPGNSLTLTLDVFKSRNNDITGKIDVV